MTAPAVLYANAADVVSSKDGEVFVRLYTGGSVIAVAGFTLEAAAAFEAEFQAGIRRARLHAPTTGAIH